jgi:uncharacterized coiled-coil protein SlyX
MMFGSMAEIDEDMIMVIADKIITERMNIVMEEQYHTCNREKIKVLNETIVKQKNDITRLHNMEETLSIQRQEITAMNEIVNEMKLKWKKDGQATILVKQHYYGHKDPDLVSQQQYHDKNTSDVNQRKSSNRPDTNFGKYSAPTQIQIKGTPIVDKKAANRFDRRSVIPINRGRKNKSL